VVLCYTVGELVRRALDEQGIGGYVPYADAQQLYERVPHWRPFRGPLQHHWQRYLEGELGYDAALELVVKDVLS
jgi:hypothetical protein